MQLRDVAKLLHTPKWIWNMVLWGILLFSVGALMNRLVMDANGGKMPVAVHTEDILFVIGNPEFGVKYFHGHEFFRYAPRHQILRDDMKYRWLADRIAIEQLVSYERNVAPPLLHYFKFIELQYRTDMIASIGDLLFWGGATLWTSGWFVLVMIVLTRIVLLLRKTKTPP